jgi:predicted DNA repair protein MutK
VLQQEHIMPVANLLTPAEDIATILGDVAILSKVTAKKQLVY